jgi:hypothetical protein
MPFRLDDAFNDACIPPVDLLPLVGYSRVGCRSEAERDALMRRGRDHHWLLPRRGERRRDVAGRGVWPSDRGHAHAHGGQDCGVRAPIRRGEIEEDDVNRLLLLLVVACHCLISSVELQIMDVLKNTPRPAAISFVPSPDKQLVFNRIPRGLILGRIEVRHLLFAIVRHVNLPMKCLGVHDVDCIQGRASARRAAGGR